MSAVPAVHRARAAVAPTGAVDSALVRVTLGVGRGAQQIGDSADALRDERLTPAERAAVRSLVQAVRALRRRVGLAGIDDAGTAVTLVLRDPTATTRGPWAGGGTINIGTRNALADRNSATGRRAHPGVLLTPDTALHELAHVVQFARIPDTARPHAAILEGLADAVAVLATGDDTLGEGFYRSGADGRPRGSIRELGERRRASGPPLGRSVRTYLDATNPATEEHEAGGLVTAVVRRVRATIGRSATEALVWRVVRDTGAWRTGGSWPELASALQRAGDALGPRARGAVDAALAHTGLDAALGTSTTGTQSQAAA